MLLFIKTDFINTVLLKLLIYISNKFFLSAICFLSPNNFFYKNTVGERGTLAASEREA